ncbi:MAG: hypothetical protein OZ921_04675 [Sorangiineae bacterium]|nr:hypothetical protein [Polyangiaceae bacterium]MEB2321786.1 hypothetical protein [Sorangiineae bacterium]
MKTRWLVAWLAALAVSLAALLGHAGQRVIPAGQERNVLALVAPMTLAGPIEGELILANVSITPSRVDFEITRGSVSGPRAAVAHMILDDSKPSGFSFTSTPPVDALDEAPRRAVEKLEATVRANASPERMARLLANSTQLPQGRKDPDRNGPPWWMLGVVVLSALSSYFAARRERRASRASLAAAAGVAGAALLLGAAFAWVVSSRGGALAAWWPHLGQATLRDRALTRLCAALAAGTLVGVGVEALHRRRGGTRCGARAWRGLLDVSLVLAWSVIVRALFTRANILTDGGSGYRRLMDYLPGFGGLSVLVDLVTPRHLMWEALRVPATLAALGPPMLTLFARQFALRPSLPIVAGLMLASLPLHAAMFTSDFLMGPALTLALAGLALTRWGAQRDHDAAVLAGASLLAFVTWLRPEAGLIGAPLVAVAWPVLRAWRRRPVALLGLGFFGANALAAQLAVRAVTSGQSLVPSLPSAHGLAFLLVPEVIPYWLSVGVVLALALRAVRGENAVLIAVGVITGAWPVAIRPTFDPTGSHMELFRYGAWMLPWLTLLAASGVVAAAERLGALVAGPSREERARRVCLGALAALLTLVMTSPIRARSYLAREYGPRSEERVFREALGQLPKGCLLLVPDDVGELGRRGRGTVEIEERYQVIADEVDVLTGAARPAMQGVTRFLDELAQRGWPRKDDGTPACVWFFEGSFCATGVEGTPAANCRQLLETVHGRPAFERRIEYISHRLVTLPHATDPPLYDAAQRLTLFELSPPPDDRR